jgi:hypothetical protein
MKLLVDFNRVDKLGRVPAVIPPGREAELVPGVVVTADDGEGTRCRAMVEGIGHNGRYVYLMPQPGTYKRRRFAAARPS